jgi:hypothetical protein
MLPTYKITLTNNNDSDLVIDYSDSFKKMSDEDISIALDDCIKSLQIQLMSITYKS